jgi:hypothetical protein
MKCLCITGPSQQDLDQTLNILKKSGLALAKATGQPGTPDIYEWHEQALAILTREFDANDALDDQTSTAGARDDVGAPLGAHNDESISVGDNTPLIDDDFPNPHLDQLAQTIIDTHASQPLWGWANEHAVWLLDYWNDYNPDIHFILVACPPEHLIAALLDEQHQSPPTAAEIAALIDAWQDNIEAMLRFYYRNMSRCLLVDYQQLAANPKGLVRLCNDKWNLDLAAPKKLALPEPQYGDLAFYLGGQITQRFPEALSLRNELLASINAIPGIEEDALTKQQNIDSIIQGYQRLRDRSPELRKIGLLQEQYNRLDEYSKVARNSYQAQYQDFMSRERKVGMEARELKTELAKARVLLAEQNQQLNAFTQNLAEKSEALANLEQQYLGIRGKLNLAEETLEQMNKVKSDLQAKLSSVGEEKQEATEENELLLLQLHQVQEELEAVFLQHQDMGKQMERITQAKEEQAKVAQERQTLISQLTQARDAQAKLAKDIQAQIVQVTESNEDLAAQAAKLRKELEVANTAKAQLEQKLAAITKELESLRKEYNENNAELLKEAEQENELLLLQLHQVQEELEHYFLQNQKLGNELAELQARLDKLYKRHPNLSEYADVTVAVVEESKVPALAWQFNNLSLAGRTFASLQVITLLEQDAITLKLENAKEILIRCPKSLNSENLEISGSNLNSATWLQELANSDWLLLGALIKLLRQHLDNSDTPVAEQGVDTKIWCTALNRLEQALAGLPAVLRFDKVRLKHEQVNPDYEHLALQLENPAYNKVQLPDFEFRLSCAHVSPGHFGEFPKLEFPESTSHGILDTWYKEADDEVGPRLELRYSVEHGPDITVWARLSEHDHALITSLVYVLPQIVSTLQTQNLYLSRDLADWQQLVTTIQQQLEEQVAATLPETELVQGPEIIQEAELAVTNEVPNSGRPLETRTNEILGALDALLGQVQKQPKAAIKETPQDDTKKDKRKPLVSKKVSKSRPADKAPKNKRKAK